MLNLRARRSLVSATILALLMVIGLPAVVSAQGRGRGQERRYERRYERRNDDGRFSRRDRRKLEKFRNGHDARDGRWDGRGPRRNRYDRYDGDNYRNRYRYRNRVRRDNSLYRNSRYYQRDDDGYYRNSDGVDGGSILGGILGSILGGQ